MATNLLLYKLRIFSLNDVMHSLSLSESATKASLCRWQQQGIIKMIRRNMYVAIDPTSDTPLADKYESASNISSDSYVGWHTAMEFHGFAHQTFFNAYVGSETRFKNFIFDDIDYTFCHSSIPATENNGVCRPLGNPFVRVTDLERTIVNSFVTSALGS